jgi:hypothetical protein
MEKQIPEKFKSWACSLSGCDGGNPEADIWICGIEWGGNNTTDYYQNKLRKEIEAGVYFPENNSYPWEETFEYPFGKSFGKLYAGIYKLPLDNYQEEILRLEPDVFKLNLYPIAFRSTDYSLWHENGLDELTGFETKDLFKTWCFLNRFPAYSKLVRKYNPKLIIGTGTSYLVDFFQCFALNNLSSMLFRSELDVDGKKYYFYHATLDNGTLLVVIPSFARPGGNSNALILQMGDRIRSLAEF